MVDARKVVAAKKAVDRKSGGRGGGRGKIGTSKARICRDNRGD